MPTWLKDALSLLEVLVKAAMLLLARQAGKDAARLEQAKEDLDAVRKQAQVAADHRADSVDDAIAELRDTGRF